MRVSCKHNMTLTHSEDYITPSIGRNIHWLYDMWCSNRKNHPPYSGHGVRDVAIYIQWPQSQIRIMLHMRALSSEIENSTHGGHKR